MANRWVNNGNSDRLYFLGAPKSLQMVTAAMKLRHLLLERRAMTKLDSVLERRDITLLAKGHIAKAMFFSNSHVRMWVLDHKECWAQNWCFQIDVLEKTLESPLGYKEIKWVNPKGNQLSIFIGRIDAGAEVPILWLLDVKSQLIVKHPDAGKD